MTLQGPDIVKDHPGAAPASPDRAIRKSEATEAGSTTTTLIPSSAKPGQVQALVMRLRASAEDADGERLMPQLA